MKNDSFWLLLIITIVLIFASLEVQQSISGNDTARQGDTPTR